MSAISELIAALEARATAAEAALKATAEAAATHLKAKMAAESEIRSLRAQVEQERAYPIGTRVRKVSGPEWDGVVVGYYSSTFTPDGLVIECTAPGAKGQVHVEPAKRIKRHEENNNA